jgi:hypothetical protein
MSLAARGKDRGLPLGRKEKQGERVDAARSLFRPILPLCRCRFFVQRRETRRTSRPKQVFNRPVPAFGDNGDQYLVARLQQVKLARGSVYDLVVGFMRGPHTWLSATPSVHT